MGPFPHDAPAATITSDNPMGTDGFEFVEYAHPKPEELHALFKLMGYVPVARHKTKKITVYRQGDINYLDQRAAGHARLRFRRQARTLRAVDGVSRGRCAAGL